MGMGKFVGEAAVSAIRSWNPLSPEAYARRDRNKAFRKARKKAKRGETLTEDEYEIFQQIAGGEFLTQDEDKQMFQALKSKTVLFGILTSAWGVVQVFLAAGDFSREAIVALVSGVVIIVLRAVTTTSLAQK